MRRTDLALEARELWQESAGETTRLEGVEAREGSREGMGVTTVRILDGRGEAALGKPRGTYITLTLEGVARREEDVFGRAARAVAGELSQLLEGVPERGLALDRKAGRQNRHSPPEGNGQKQRSGRSFHHRDRKRRHLVGRCT